MRGIHWRSLFAGATAIALAAVGCSSSDETAGGSSGSGGSGNTAGGGGSGNTAGSGGSGNTAGSGGSGNTAGGGGSGNTAGGGGSGNTAGGGGSAGVNAGGSAGATCNGSHPLLDASARFCAVGECRCLASDACFSQATAASCCNGQLECFTADGGVQCQGTHPLVDAGARYCAPGNCYCSDNDACYPSALADACCGSNPTCN